MKSSQSKDEWQKNTLEPVLKKSAERQAKFEYTSGIPLDVVYAPDDLKDFDPVKSVGFPGEYPFVRGVQPNMYRGRMWTMRMYAGFASAEESNRRYRYLLEQGQTGLSVAFDLPTQIGYDSDHPLAEGEVGKVGVPIDTLRDVEDLFQGIPLDKVSTSMTINSTAPILLAMYVALAKKQGADLSKIDGTIQNDVLKEYVARGTQIFPPKPSMRLTTDIFKFCGQNVPRWNTISISGYHMREAGATAAQEIAFTLANGIAYVQAAIDVGLDVDKFAGRLSFFFDSYNNLFEEVAKFRAARRMWAKIMSERFGAKDPRSCMLRFHTQTAGFSLTAQQPYNNIVRTAIQALAAVLGGTQSLHTNSFDEAYAVPCEEAVTVALRTQQILAFENGIGDVVDPLGGSYFIESLTDAMEKEATAMIKKVDSLGGSMAAIETGHIQREIRESAYRAQRAVESSQRVIVGVNKFQSPYPEIGGLLQIDPEAAKKQKDRLAQVKKERDQSKVDQSLKRLEDVAKGTDNTMPVILEAVEAYASLGEICTVLRGVFGEHKESMTL